MPRIFVADARPGDVLQQPFLVQSKDLRTQRSGALYLDLELMDRTGVVPAKMWDADRELYEAIAEDDLVMVKARAETYRRKLQLVVTDLRPVQPSEVSLEDFLPSTKQDVASLVRRLRALAAEVAEPHLAALLGAFLDDREFLAAFQRAPGGLTIHHAWLGGLLEHTVAVAELARGVGERYPNLDRDLLLAGAILHDIGKVESFDYSRALRYTDAGGLVGHLPMGAAMVARRAEALGGFPRPLLEQLQHLILSHHGQHEFGSPVLPATAEAIALHYIDNLDAKLGAYELALLGDEDERSRWTSWNRVFGRRLFKPPP
ncbi:MAG: 3'-5' exoribonuclease YhaM family protein [Candidatus Brocadiia bacterium]